MARVQSLVLSLAILGAVCFLCRIVNYATYKQISVMGLVGFILPRVCFIATQFMLFLVLVRLTFDVRLQSRVTQWDQVFVVAIDAQGREEYSFELNPTENDVSGFREVLDTQARDTFDSSKKASF